MISPTLLVGMVFCWLESLLSAKTKRKTTSRTSTFVVFIQRQYPQKIIEQRVSLRMWSGNISKRTNRRFAEYVPGYMKSRSRCLLLLLLTLQLPLVHEVDQVLPHKLLDGNFLLLDIVVFLDLLLLKGQVFQIRINSVGNEEILHLGDDFFEVFDFLQFQFLVAHEAFVEGVVESVVFLSGETSTSWLRMSMKRKILQSSRGRYEYWSLLNRGMKTLYFQQSLSLFSSSQISQILMMAEGWKDLSLPSMRARNFSFIWGEKYWSLTLQYLRKNFSNSLGYISQSISSICAYICFQKSSDLLLSFFMRWYIDMQSFLLMRLKLLFTKSKALDTQACWFQSCFSCPGTYDRNRSPSTISLYSSRSTLSKANRIQLGVRRFQWMRSEFSMQSGCVLVGLQMWRTRMGILMGKVIRLLDWRLGGRMRKTRSQRSSLLLFRRMRSLKLPTFCGVLYPKPTSVVSERPIPCQLCNLIISPLFNYRVEKYSITPYLRPPTPYSPIIAHNFYLKRKKMTEHLHFLSDMGKLAELKYKKRPIIAEFYTEWCPPCKPTRTILEKELREGGGKFSLACINCDEAEELNIEYEIEGVPTIIALNCDEKLTVFDKVVGYDAKKIKDFMERVKKELIDRKN